MKVVFFGTPTFAAKTLSFLLEHGINVVAVITKPDKPKGRSAELIPTPVKLIAQGQVPQIPLYQPELVSAPEFADTLSAYQADLFVVVAYGEIIKQHLLDMPKIGCINVHASLLPSYRGAAPIQRSIINGDPITGITIMHMAKKMDAGDIIRKAEVPIGPNMTYGELEKELCLVGNESLLKVIREFEQGKPPRIIQDHSQATYAPKIELEDCQIQWQLPAQTIHNLVRGVNPHPGAWCWISIKGQKKRLKVYTTKVVPEMEGIAGTVLCFGKNGLVIACGQQALSILQIQLEGKKTMTIDEFVKGFSQEQSISFNQFVNN